MGFLDLFGPNFEKMSDYEAGIWALEVFHSKAMQNARQRNGAVYTFDKLIEVIESAQGGRGHIAGLGLGIKVSGNPVFSFGRETSPMTPSDVRKSMEALADRTMGHVPKEIELFRQALIMGSQAYAKKIEYFLEDTFTGRFLTAASDITHQVVDMAPALAKEVGATGLDLLRWRQPLLIGGGLVLTLFLAWRLTSASKGLIREGGKQARSLMEQRQKTASK
jgi:hypothetical protein